MERTSTPVISKTSFAMNTVNLKSPKLDVETANDVFKVVLGVTHEFHCLLLCHRLMKEHLWLLEIREENEKDAASCTWNFNEVDFIRNVMEVSIEHLSVWGDTIVIPAYLHGRRSLFGYNTERIISHTPFTRRRLRSRVRKFVNRLHLLTLVA